MEKHKPKVVETAYYVLVDNELRTSFASLSEARKEVKSMSITENIKEVRIVKQTISHTLVDSYVPKTTKTLTIEEFDWN